MAKRYGLMGVNDDTDTCEICGRTNLKRVMWLVELDREGNEVSGVFAAGTTCGATMLGYTHSKIRTKVKNYANEVYQERSWLERNHPSYKLASECIDRMNELNLFGCERGDHQLYKQMSVYRKEAKDWAMAQKVVIEL